MLELFPNTAAVDDAELSIGGVRATALADEFGTPVLVYCEDTLRAQARAFRAIDPQALVVYGTKAFANVALLELFASEGLGADVSTLGELAFAQRAGIRGNRVVFHGNNKSDHELRAAAAEGALVVLDSEEEIARAAAADIEQTLLRLTPGIDAETHRSIQTAHAESKFGIEPERALGMLTTDKPRIVGIHVHIGSQLTRADESLAAVDEVVAFCERARAENQWTPRIVDLGGGLGVRHSTDEDVPSIDDFAGAVVRRFRERWPHDVQLILEPGRALIGRAGVTLYRIGSTKRSGGITYVAIDGGMSDNPRPQLYGAKYEPVVANRMNEDAVATFRIAGKHCESGDVLVDAAHLPEPRRGDVLAVPATGAYTLAMASTYNGVPRPAAVLVANGSGRLIRRRETVDDLLAFEQ